VRKLLFLVSVLILVGCGGGSGTVVSTPQEPTLPDGTEKMIAGQTYQVSSGDQVVKTSENAQIKVLHVDGEVNSTIELVLGEANIVRIP